MRIVVAVVGRPKHAGLAAAIGDYERRAARYWPIEVAEVREEPPRGGGDRARAREGERLGERLRPDARLVACDVGGARMTSEEFAAWLQRAREDARDVAFAIGGAYGLSPGLRERAASRLALAPWTLPHELARLVLA